MDYSRRRCGEGGDRSVLMVHERVEEGARGVVLGVREEELLALLSDRIR